MSTMVPFTISDASAEGPRPDTLRTLDDPAEWKTFSRPIAGCGTAWESWLAIEGMDCAGCALSVEDALATCAGVQSAQVNGATATARIVWNAEQGRPSRWWDALRRAGYGAVPAGDMLAAAPRDRARRILLWRWLVAGFCMMQVMMYGTPAYLADPSDISPDARALLRWASWLLTLPVLLFSCRPFFVSAWRDVHRLRAGMDVPVALGILVAFAASTSATFDPASALGGEVWFDSITMFVFFLLSGRLLEQRLRDRTAGALEALARRLPDTVERQVASGRFERVTVRRLAVGDCIRVLAGEVIPADGVVLEGATTIDEALLTGESRPLARGPGAQVVAGTQNLSAPIVVRVERCGDRTRFAEIVALMERASVDKPRLARLADRIAGRFLLAVIAASVCAGAWWWRTDPAHSVGVAVAVLIVTCPCALSLATPAAALAAAGALARRGILVRRLGAFEDAARVDAVVFDKTGTLSEERMTVIATHARDGLLPTTALAIAGAMARQSLHPLSRALATHADADADADVLHVTEWREIPGRGVQACIARTTLRGPFRLGAAGFCDAPALAGDGPQVHLADADGWLATFELGESLRADAHLAVDVLTRRGIGTELLSGDGLAAASRIASLAGIGHVTANSTPEGKLAHVRELQARGRHVAMVGDGMNDGPVLAVANVSIVIGDAVPVAQARCDFIVNGGRLAAVPQLIAHARRCTRIVRQNLAWAAGYNLVCVPLAVVGWMPPWLAGLGMAASSLMVVANSARLARVHEPLPA